MALVGDDCYFFCTSTCAKGASCTFRHVEAAKTAKIICQHWQLGHCSRPMCKFRHSTFEIPLKAKAEVLCFWESQPSGCTRPNCVYRHSKPRIPLEGEKLEEKSVMSNTVIKPETPQVMPVIIQPADSEESNTSPIKRGTDSSSLKQGEGDSASETNQTFKDVGKNAQTDNRKEEPTSQIKAEEGDAKQEVAKAQVQVEKPAETKTEVPAETKSPVKKVTKKVVKKVVKKKAVSTEKSLLTKVEGGDNGGGKKVVKKKVVNSRPSSATAIVATKAGVKAKVAGKPTAVARPISAKSRLGIPAGKKKKSESSDESSGSDDSIENIKVMSVEEILRRKALESMMKKRASEGKEMMPKPKPKSDTRIDRLASPKRVSSPPRKKEFLKQYGGLKKHQINYEDIKPSQNWKLRLTEERLDDRDIRNPEETEEESEETEESSEESSSESEESEEESESEESDSVERRVIIDEEGEKAARKRAKASLVLKQKQAAAAAAKAKAAEKLHKTITGKVGKVASNKGQKRLLSGALSALGQTSTTVATKAAGKRRTIISKTEEAGHGILSRVKKPVLSIRERLGRHPEAGKTVLERAARLVEARDAGISSAGEGSPHRLAHRRVHSLSEGEEEEEDSSTEEEEEEEGLTGVKVKSLEEIKRERLKKQPELEGSIGGSPVRRKLALSDDEEDNKESQKGRKIMIVTEPAVRSSPEKQESKPEDQRKAVKRRPWRSQRAAKVVDSSLSTQEDLEQKAGSPENEQTRAAQSPPRTLEASQEEPKAQEKVPVPKEVELSPFELLKRRALERKIKQRQQALLERAAAVDQVHTKKKEDTMEDVSYPPDEEESRKSHKHKHKHKQKHKRSKAERQIYVPPGSKSSVPSLLEEETDLSGPHEEDTKKKGRHRIAAAWTAGLSLTSKGTVPLRRGDVPGPTPLSSLPTEKPPPPASALERLAPASSDPKPDPAAPVTIKSFSEIMAEKRKRRLEVQAQKQGGGMSATTSLASSNSSLASSTESKSSPVRTDNKRRAPITPIVFDIDSGLSNRVSGVNPASSYTAPFSTTGTASPPKAARFASPGETVRQPIPSVPAHTRLKPDPPAASSSDSVPSAKKSKKLFKKKKSTDTLGSASHTPAPQAKPVQQSKTAQAGLALTETASVPDIAVEHFQFDDEDDELDLMPYEAIDPTSSNPTVHPEASKPATSQEGNSTSTLTLKTQDVDESEVVVKKSRLSIDDELNLEDGDEVIPVGNESIDDLLQDIDDLLA